LVCLHNPCEGTHSARLNLLEEAEFGQLRAYVIREGTPHCLIQLDHNSASFWL